MKFQTGHTINNGRPSWNKGKKLKDTHPQMGFKKGHKSFTTEEGRKRQGQKVSGSNGGTWNGGCWNYWKKQALTRDDYTCQICGLRDIEIMEVDHIRPKCDFPELKFVLDNLLILCPNCHSRKTNRELKNRFKKNEA